MSRDESEVNDIKILFFLLFSGAYGLAFCVLMKDCIHSSRQRKENEGRVDPIKDKLLFIEQVVALLVGTHFGFCLGTLIGLLLEF